MVCAVILITWRSCQV